VAGDVVAVTTRMLEVRAKVLRFSHEMRNEVTGDVAASTVLTAVHLHLTTRRATHLPLDVRAQAVARLPKA
jgi:acyl-CoA thioester hydrolase